MSSGLLLRASNKRPKILLTHMKTQVTAIYTREYHYLLHRFNGYKYSGHYSNIKIVDPNLERYSPLMMIPRKGYNRFSFSQQMKESIPFKFATATVLSIGLTYLLFTEKENWKSYKIANRIFYYAFKPVMEIMAFTLNLNVQGPKIEVPDKMSYHRDSDCKVITNLDFSNVSGEESPSDVTDATPSIAKIGNDSVEPIQPLDD